MIKAALLGDSSTQLFALALRGYALSVNYNLDLFESDYDQIDLQVSDPGSDLYTSNPRFIIVFHSPRKLLKEFYKLPAAERSGFAEHYLNRVKETCETINSRTSATIIWANLPMLDDGIFGQFSNKLPMAWPYQQRSINTGLMKLAAEEKNLFIADFDLLQSRVGMGDVHNSAMYVSSDIIFSLDFMPVAAKAVMDIIKAVSGMFAKCLVLDLDNTVWGGVIGDDGIDKIQIGDLGIGKAYTELQLWAKELKERGVILAVCSKNTDSIAREPFEKHPDMILRMEDIAVFVANWENKVDNIRHIQSVLNIGFDSMVFLDDNPFERNMVRDNVPGLVVPELPEDPADYIPFLRTLNLFETATFESADAGRTLQYQVEAKRVVLQQQFTSEAEFLGSLDMKSDVKAFDKYTIPRIAQLSQRSNQFNLRTVRYTEADLVRITEDRLYHTVSFSLKDKFGDYGLVSAIVLSARENELFLENWIMSCRVLKRGMEAFVYNKIVNIAREYGFAKVTAEYIPTAKNGIVANLLPDLGFVKNDKWELDATTAEHKSNFIKAT
ncbi:MAG TPA: HAD-IIIC family phosphatase [Bacteroidia bacterium]|nr:HAD-IIIC family phosphatase [Bacteroidia bacterium]